MKIEKKVRVYKTSEDIDKFQEKFNEWIKDGWRAVLATPITDGSGKTIAIIYYFEREKDE